MKRRRVEESADGLALMTSSVTSRHSADDLREQSQESAGFRNVRRRSAAAIFVQPMVHNITISSWFGVHGIGSWISTDGSQYKQSAVGLVFMESAAGLAMETSKVESAVRNQAEAKINQLEHIAIQEAKKSRKMELERRRSAGSYNNQLLRRCARYGISCDDISLDVITISKW
ncbi:filament-like plant protein 7 [Dorcoceras hygrometricum]|uniref:Filament-like plant protein 7 n=1 Tax=Dorcoceras hygrometricum TaxID=472368 RepID=A0A2Z7BB93_9LAMI|nr:filament-like plant protein 7 [Dorcoceras hygrometricum]